MDNRINITQTEMELIEKYLANTLSPTEEQAFKHRVETDVLLQQKIKEIEMLTVGIKEAALRKKMNSYHQPVSTGNVNAPATKASPIKRLALAATLVLGLLTISWLLFLKKSTEEKLFVAYYAPDSGLPTTMGATDNYEFSSAMVEYKTGNYTEAVRLWKNLLKTNANNDTLNYFIGSALLANNQTGEARPYFDKVLNVKTSSFFNNALWYKGLSFLKEGQKQEAVEILQEAKHPEKQSLLDKLLNN